MRSLIVLGLLAASSAAQSNPVSRPDASPPPRVVVPPVKLPAPVVAAPEQAPRRVQSVPALASASERSQRTERATDQTARAAKTHLRSRVHFDTVDGQLWARGRDFKATFTAEGLTFIPF